MSERNAKGKFVKGNKGGPGNPHARKVAELRSLLLECVSKDDLKAVIQRLVEDAKAGNQAATKELLSRLLGGPVDSIHPDDLNHHDSETQRMELIAEQRLKSEIESANLFGEF